MRTRRKFSAFLVMGPDGKTSFEFEPRKEGAGPKKSFFKKPALETKDIVVANGKAEKATKPKKKAAAKKSTAKKNGEGTPRYGVTW